MNTNTLKKRALIGLVFVLAFAVFGTAAFAGILKSPYLIYPGQNTQMQVLWQDNASEATNVISWGTDTLYSMGTVTVLEDPAPAGTNPLTGLPYPAINTHKYTITGLTPNTKYFYQVADQTNGVYGTGSFITAPDVNVTSIRFTAQGDSRTNPFTFDNLVKAMKAFYSQPGYEDYQRLSIHNGDWVSTDGESYWTTQWFDPTKTDIVAYTSSTPINGVKGNHDNSSGYSYFFPKYFPFPYPGITTVATTDATKNYPKSNNLYWSFDYGPVHFTFVDQYSTYAVGSAQYNWLVNDLATTTKPWKVLVYHAPAYSAGSDADDVSVRALEPLVIQYGVDVIYCGHSHNYARTGAYTLAQAGGDTIALNVPHITSGGGGAPVYQPDMTNMNNYPHVITAWPSTEFMAFDIQGKTLTMTAYQVNNASSSAINPLSTTFPAADGGATLSLSPIETTVVNHFTNVSPQVSVTSTGFLYSRATGKYTGNLTVTNNGSTDLTGNIHVVLDGILNLQGIGNADNQYSTKTPKQTSKIAANPATGKTSPAGSGLISTVTLVNATGSNNGEPMIRVSDNGLAAGASITVPLQFSNPSNVKINFNPVTYQE
jgi:predicted phosphodiesterase